MAHFKDLAAINGVNIVTRFQASIFGRTVRFNLADFDGQTLILATNDNEAPRYICVGPLDGHVDNLFGHLDPLAAHNQLLDKLGRRQKNQLQTMTLKVHY